MNKYLKAILKEGRKMAEALEYVEKNKIALCSPKCAACLAAEARSKVDRDLGDKAPCLVEGDPYMLQAKHILVEELGWEPEGEEEKEIISENEFSENKHEHLQDLRCPKCGKGLKPIFNRNHLVGCMEYQIFICDKDSCRVLIIYYPHESAGKENKIINL